MADNITVDLPDPAEFGRVGELVYLVDPFIYPALFGSPEMARAAMPQLMAIANSPFERERVRVARIGAHVVGVLVLYLEPFAHVPDFTSFYEGDLQLPSSCRDVCERYFAPLCESVSADQAYILCIATDPAFRGRGVASALLGEAAQSAAGRPVVLDVLEDNGKAIRLYERMGFCRCGESAGYSYCGPSPKVLRMRRAGSRDTPREK